MSERPWLSEEENIELTGFKLPSKQEKWCNENKIRCWMNGMGRLRIPRDAVSGMLPGAAPKVRPRVQPDFTKLRNAS
jgi:hypothetical protein